MKIKFDNNNSYQLCCSYYVPGSSHTLSYLILPRILCPNTSILQNACILLLTFPISPTSQILTNTILLSVSVSSTFFLSLMSCLDASLCIFQAVGAEIVSTALPSCAFNQVYSIKTIKISLPSFHPIFSFPLQQLSLPASFKFKLRF